MAEDNSELGGGGGGGGIANSEYKGGGGGGYLNIQNSGWWGSVIKET